MSKSNIKKSRKGFKNYWLYHSINKQTPLGVLYSLNYIFLTSTVVFTIFAVALGFIKELQPILFVISVLICIIEIPSTIVASICSNNEKYGKPFILLEKRKSMKGYSSSLVDIFSWVINALLIYLSYQQL